ncbi:MAG: FHA domain-containing protein [Prevotella sp.]|uniref:FHA domain-containing protein n=1 Tax=Prevotella sp. TaxID=59823 RepID=UPI0025D97B8E|nr:FHA domain-containing protein [Prevotella sp.]MCI7119103.1 FHA domain-containing protein [Prevotella sp.]
MEIIIGREEGVRRLHCIVEGREFNVGQAGSVPLSVSRRHCKISVNGSNISIENIKAQNVTFVDGNQIYSKVIAPTSRVQLGEENFLVPLQQILQLAGASTNNVGDTIKGTPTFSLKPMKEVWKEYDKRRMEIQNNAVKSANKQRLQGIFSMLGMCLGFIPGINPIIRIVIIVAALSIAVYFFIKGSVGETVQQQLHDLDEEYAKKYKCPNPACGRPFGAIPYRNIEYNKQCLACGCKYTH